MNKTKEELQKEIEMLNKRIKQYENMDVVSIKEEALDSSIEEEWQMLMDILGDYIIVVNTSGKIIKINPIVAQKLGYSRDELLSMNIFDLYPRERSNEAEDIYSQIIIGERFLCDIPFKTKDGRQIDVETKITLGKWRDSNVIFSISRDVTAGKAIEFELRYAFEKLKTVIDSVSAYIWSARVDEKGAFSYIYQSPFIERLTGKTMPVFQKGPEQWFDIIHGDDVDNIRKIYNGLISGDLSVGEEIYRIIHSDGTVRWVRDSTLARRFGNNQVRFDGVITDITERRSAMEALKESESRLRGILSSMADMVFAFDQDTRFTFYHTPEMGNLYIEPDKFTGERHNDIMPPELHESFMKAFEKTRELKESEFEYWLSVSEGQKYFSTKLSPIMKDGEFDGAVAVVRDITEKQLLENRLKISEQKYRQLFNNILDGYAMTDMTGKITEFNPAFQKIIGYDREDIFNLTVGDITPEKWNEAETKIIEEQVMKRGYSDLFKKEYIRKDGEIIPVEIRIYLVKNNAENIGMWAIVREL